MKFSNAIIAIILIFSNQELMAWVPPGSTQNRAATENVRNRLPQNGRETRPAPNAREVEHGRELRRGRRVARGNENSNRVTQVGVGALTHGGNGCPQGTMRVAFAPDNLSFSVLFDQFVAEVSGGAARARDTMSCDIRIPLIIPAGQQMEITRVDFRGYAGLPANSRAMLNSVFNFRGVGDRDRMVMRYAFNGPMNEDYEISSDVLLQNGRPVGTEVSPCGGRSILVIRNTVRVVSASPQESAMVTIDSIDSSSKSVYYVNWRSCRG